MRVTDTVMFTEKKQQLVLSERERLSQYQINVGQ